MEGQAASPGGAQPPAGWYPDTQVPGQQRYWDGGRWTEHVHPPPAGPAPGQAAPGYAPPGSSPDYSPPAPGYSPPAPGYAPPGASPATPPSYAPPGPISDGEVRQWALFAHLSALGGLIIGLPFVGPLIIYLAKKDAHPFIADQAREALNFNLSVFIYEVVGILAAVVLAIVLIGFLLIPVVIAIAVAWLVLVIIAAIRANGGEAYRYPLTIRMVR